MNKTAKVCRLALVPPCLLVVARVVWVAHTADSITGNLTLALLVIAAACAVVFWRLDGDDEPPLRRQH